MLAMFSIILLLPDRQTHSPLYHVALFNLFQGNIMTITIKIQRPIADSVYSYPTR